MPSQCFLSLPSCRKEKLKHERGVDAIKLYLWCSHSLQRHIDELWKLYQIFLQWGGWQELTQLTNNWSSVGSSTSAGPPRTTHAL